MCCHSGSGPCQAFCCQCQCCCCSFFEVLAFARAIQIESFKCPASQADHRALGVEMGERGEADPRALDVEVEMGRGEAPDNQSDQGEGGTCR